MFLLFVILAGLLLASCTTDISGGSGTDVGNARVACVVYNPDGNPASGATVRLRPDDFLPGTLQEIEGKHFDLQADYKGRVEIAGIDSGSYYLELVDTADGGGAAAALVMLNLELSEKIDLGRIDLKPSAAITGVVDAGGIDSSSKATVMIYGLDRVTFTDSTGRFTIKDLPAAELKLKIVTPLSFIPDQEISIVAASEDLLDLGIFNILDSVLENEMQIVCELIRENGVVEYSIDQMLQVTNKRIVGLDLSYLGLHTITPALGRLSDLLSLNCTGNTLSDLPDSLAFCRMLRRLNISQNSFVSVPEVVWTFDSLHMLDLSYNLLTGKLSENLGQLIKLDTLYTGQNEIDTLPDALYNLNSVKVFTSDGNNLTSLPSGIGGMTGMWKLVVNGNQLRTLPDEIGNCISLRVLYCPLNSIDMLPQSILNLSLLEEINFRQNKLINLPLSSQQMKTLKKVEIGSNYLCALPDSVSTWLDTIQPGWRIEQSCR